LDKEDSDNMNWQRTIGLLLVGLGLLVLTLKYSANYDVGPAVATWAGKVNPKWAEALNRKAVAGYVAIGVMAVPMTLGAILFIWGLKRSANAGAVSTTAISVRSVKSSARSAPIHACNVLRIGGDPRQLYHFETKGGNFVLRHEQAIKTGEPLPARLVGKDWHQLFQPKLNIALIPPEQVFLRVVQLPASDFAETVSMVELQLEKLSPMPVAQIVWSVHVFPRLEGNLQTVIVMVVSRNVVEELLGTLEGQGFLADRLELPLVDELQLASPEGDGAWIYPVAGRNSALVAWRYGGILRNLDLLTLAPENRAGALREQLLQMAWAGEMEGWLTSPPTCHLVADESARATWEPILKEGLEQDIIIDTRLSSAELAATTARRGAKADANFNLVPAEFQTRYQQQFVDRLWMRGLGAVVGLYMIGVAIYFVALSVASYNTRGVEEEAAAVAPTYTNAMQFKARYQVLKDRQELKFAALDCWNKTATLLPPDVTLETLNFNDGRQLRLNGTAPADQAMSLIDFETSMRKSLDNSGQALFDATSGDNINQRSSPNGAVAWNLTLELKRAESR
jgi:hypothetical protein